MGDTDLPESPISLGFSRVGSRTCCIEGKGEYSASPAPRIADPPDPKSRTPAAAGTVAGANAVRVTLEDHRKDYITPAFGAISPLFGEVLP